MQKLITLLILVPVLIVILLCSLQTSADSHDLTSYRYISEDAFEYALLNDLKPYASDYLRVGYENGLDPIFLAAKDAYESGWGTSYLAKSNNNLSGWKDSSGNYMYFDSYTDCINHTGAALKENYLSGDGKYFNGYSVSDVGETYAEYSEWDQEIIDIMYQIESRIDEYNQN